MLKDIFVVVGQLTFSVGLVLPGMIAHTANQVQEAAQDLAEAHSPTSPRPWRRWPATTSTGPTPR